MTSTVKIDKAGRVVLPKAVRDGLRITPGDTLELKVEGERVILRPSPPVVPLQKERGVWVFRTGEKLSVGQINEVTRSTRDERGSANLKTGG